MTSLQHLISCSRPESSSILKIIGSNWRQTVCKQDTLSTSKSLSPAEMLSRSTNVFTSLKSKKEQYTTIKHWYVNYSGNNAMREKTTKQRLKEVRYVYFCSDAGADQIRNLFQISKLYCHTMQTRQFQSFFESF